MIAVKHSDHVLDLLIAPREVVCFRHVAHVSGRQLSAPSVCKSHRVKPTVGFCRSSGTLIAIYLNRYTSTLNESFSDPS